MAQNNKKNIDLLDSEILRQKKMQEAILDEQAPLKTVYSWDAPTRAFSPKSKRWFVLVAFIALLLIVIAALTDNLILVFAIVSFVLVLYAINTVPPKNIRHTLTNKGIYSFNTLFLWKNIRDFWLTKRGEDILMHVEYRSRSDKRYFDRMIVLVGKGDIKKIATFLVRYVDYLSQNEAEQNILATLSDGQYMPLLNIIGEADIYTKDPNDAPVLLKTDKETKSK